MKSKLLLTLCTLILFQLAFAQQARIQGFVKSSDNYPVANVSVQLDNGKSVKTNSAGYFSFTHLAAGGYLLKAHHVGLSHTEQIVQLEQGQTKDIVLTLSYDQQKIQEVLVKGKKGAAEQKLSDDLRVQTPWVELPQNVQIVNSQTLESQQIFNLADGLMRNVSGISRSTHWNDMYVNLRMRGSQLQAFRNGMNVVSSFWSPLSEDMAVVERVEFVKGPAGFMMSSGDPAGIYNVVTKKPSGENKGEVSFAMGSFNALRTAIDLDGIASKNGKLLYRLNVVGDKKSSFRPFEESKRFVIAPVLSYQLSEQTKATLEYTYQKAIMSDIGSAYVMSPFGYKSLPRDVTFSMPGLEPLDVDEHNVNVHVQHKLSENWKLTAQGAYFKYNQVGASSWLADLKEDGKAIRKSDIWDALSYMAMGQVFVNGTFQTGAVQHKILAGIDVGSKQYYADWGQSHILDTVDGGEFNPLDPTYTADEGFPVFDRSLAIKTRGTAIGGTMETVYSSVYIQDELGFLDNTLRLTLAGRYTRMGISTWGGALVESSKVTPRIGLSYSFDPNTTAYALYDQAFLPQNGILQDRSEVKPITGNNIEIGVKREWFAGKLQTSVSGYKIVKNHEITSVGPEKFDNIEVGQKTVKGIEFDLRGQLYPGLQLIANYAYTDGIVSKVNDGVDNMEEGERLPSIDKHVTNIILNYELQQGAAKGLGVNAGYTNYSDRGIGGFSKTNPEYNLENYGRLDAGIFFTRDKFAIRLNVSNVLDTYLLAGGSFYEKGVYFPSSAAYSWQADPPRNYRLSFHYKF